MRKIACLLTLLPAVLVGASLAAPAQAQENRTFVSAAGSDFNVRAPPPLRLAGTSQPPMRRRPPEARWTYSIRPTTAR